MRHGSYRKAIQSAGAVVACRCRKRSLKSLIRSPPTSETTRYWMSPMSHAIMLYPASPDGLRGS